MQARLESTTATRVGNERGAHHAPSKPKQPYPQINPALLLPRLSDECKAQIVRTRNAIPEFDAKQWAMVERYLLEQGVAPSFTGTLTVDTVCRSYEQLLEYIASPQESSQDLGELGFELSFARAPYNASLEVKIERWGFGFMDLSPLYECLGKPFVQALSLIDIVLHDILPSEFYCEYSGHFWPLNECSEDALDGGMAAIMQEVNEFAEGEYEEDDIAHMVERMNEIKERGQTLMTHWCSTETVFAVIEAVEKECESNRDCPISAWCLRVTKTIRDAFGSSRNWNEWYNTRPEAYNDGFEPIVALHDDWEFENDAYQMAFESGEVGQTYTINSDKDIWPIKRVCELRSLGATLLEQAVELSNKLYSDEQQD